MPPGFPNTLRTTRRGFLRLAGTTTALAALAQLRAAPTAAAVAVPSSGPGFFSPGDREILTQVVERMVETGEPGAPRVRDTGAVQTIEALCTGLDPAVTEPLPLLLKLVEYGPFLFDLTFTRFTRMTDAQKDASLQAWMQSRLALRRMGFMALRNLAMLGYWAQEETWPLIGYAGPLLRRPERSG